MAALTKSQAEAYIQSFYKTYLPTMVSKAPDAPNDAIKLFELSMAQGSSVKASYDLVIAQGVVLAATFEHAYASNPTPTGSQFVDAVGFANTFSGTEVIKFLYPSASAADKSTLLSAMNAGSLSITQFASGFSIAKATNSSPSADEIMKAPASLTPGSALPESGLHFNGLSDGQQDFLVSMYIGAFGRAPEFDGLKYWATELANDLKSGHAQNDSYLMVGHNMYAAGSQNGEGGTQLDNSAYVNFAYNNALGRAADADGAAYWINNLNSGGLERFQFLTTFLTAAQNSERDATFLGARVGVGEFAAQQHVSGVNKPPVDLKGIIAPVHDIPTAQTAIDGIINQYGLAPSVAPIQLAGITTFDASVHA